MPPPASITSSSVLALQPPVEGRLWRRGLRARTPQLSAVDVHPHREETGKDEEDGWQAAASSRSKQRDGVGGVPNIFMGSAVSLKLAVPLSRFYTKPLYDCFLYANQGRERKRPARPGARVRLIFFSRRDLMFWRKLRPKGRCVREPDAEVRAHSDAADLGWSKILSRYKTGAVAGKLVGGKEVDDHRLEGAESVAT